MYPTYAPNASIGRRNAYQTLAQWRAIHRPFGREAWYQALLAQFHRLPAFTQMWEVGSRELDDGADTSTTLLQTPYTPEPVYEHKVTLTLGPTVFPQIVLAVPMDDVARTVFAQLGALVMENRWEAVLTLGGNNATPSTGRAPADP